MWRIHSHRLRLLLCGLLVLPIAGALAADFRSVGDSPAIFYDAPSLKAKKLFVVGADYPVGLVVVIGGWTKVRDASGELAWVESKQLSERRTVLVTARSADVRQAAEEAGPLVFRAEQGVLLELIEPGPPGWLKVRHRDGQRGYVKTKSEEDN